MKRQNPFLEWALYYAREKHWPVFPLAPRQKVPRKGSRGLSEATTDEAVIQRWWHATPNANIGVAMGNGNFVLDEDPRHGGEETRAKLVQRYGRLGDTLQATTPNHGRHYFWHGPEQVEIPTRAPARDDWPGIDVRGSGGYVAVHPSEVVNARGQLKRYEWDGVAGEEEPIAPAPGWLVEAILERGSGGAAGAAAPVELPELLKQGSRDTTIYRMACAFRRARAEYADVVARLVEYDRRHCVPPLGERVVKAKVDSAWKKPAGDGQPLENPVALPEPLSVDQVLDLDVALPEMLIENLLPRRGLTLMTGAQRSGKTVWAAQTAIALATNKPLFDYYSIAAHGPVIVMEKDDPGGDASFKDLYLRAGVPRGTPIHYYGHDRIPIPLGWDFCQWLEAIVPKTGAVMVVLDSYTALRQAHKPGGDIVLEERRDISQLDALAKRLGCLILLLHHESITTRANGSLDWDARGAGTYGMTMAAECQIAICRYRELAIDAPERFLRFRSRHLKEQQLTLRYDPGSGLFRYVLDGGPAALYPMIHEIKRRLPTAAFSAKDLEEPLGISRPTAFRHVAALVSAGAAWRDQNGGYRLAPEIERLVIP